MAGGDMAEWESLAYNYVFFNARESHLEPVIGEYRRFHNIRVFIQAFNNKSRMAGILFFLHWSSKINRVCRLPGKHIWYRRMYGKRFDNTKPICFVFLEGKYIAEDKGFPEYIRLRDSRNRAVIYYWDLISKKQYHDFESIRNRADFVLTYDRGEAEAYGILCTEVPVYGAIKEPEQRTYFDAEVYFLGHAKDRLPDIMAVYEKLHDNGVRCRFLLAGVPAKKRISTEGVFYIDRVPYATNLEYIASSKCILEISQHGAVSNTLRGLEALVYKRKLLTNIPFSRDSKFRSDRELSYFKTPEDIDIGFIRRPIEYSSFDNRLIDALSPLHWLEHLDDVLQRQWRKTNGKRTDDGNRQSNDIGHCPRI